MGPMNSQFRHARDKALRSCAKVGIVYFPWKSLIFIAFLLNIQRDVFTPFGVKRAPCKKKKEETERERRGEREREKSFSFFEKEVSRRTYIRILVRPRIGICLRKRYKQRQTIFANGGKFQPAASRQSLRSLVDPELTMYVNKR